MRGFQLFLLGAICLQAFSATAQESSDPLAQASAEGSQSGGLQEVLVTARKREESSQNVPVAVTALSAEQIQRYDLTSIEKVSAQTPEFTVAQGSNGAGAELTLRGIGSAPTSIGVEQSVAVVVDGVYFGLGRVINEGLFDASGVEILKGPQALFFGKNATAGLVSLTTSDPTDRFEAMGRAAYEFYGKEVTGEGFVSGPLTSTLSGRLAVHVSNMYGSYVKNGAYDVLSPSTDVATGAITLHPTPAFNGSLPGTDDDMVRATLKWEPTTQLTATLKASYNRSEEVSAWNYVPYACSSGFSQVNPAIPCRRAFEVYVSDYPQSYLSVPYAQTEPYNLYESHYVTGTVSYDFGAAKFTSVSNYNHTNNTFACQCQNITTATAFFGATDADRYHAFSNETRLSTDLDGPINVMVGTYYQNTRLTDSAATALLGLEDSSQSDQNRYLFFSKESATDGETLAGFAQVRWQVLPRLEFAGGARYTDETKDSFLQTTYVNPAVTFLVPAGSRYTVDQRFINWSPESTLTWRLTDAVTLYGAYKTGYKSGGFNNSALITATETAADITFSPERVDGFEAGLKTTSLDRQLRVNLGLYRYRYRDLQVDFFNSSTFQYVTTNAGSARTSGVELEFEAAPRSLSGLSVNGSLNYGVAKYLEYISPCYAGQSIEAGCSTTFRGAPGQDLSGRPTALAPKWTGALGAAYETDVSTSLVLEFSANARYSGSYFSSAFAAPLSVQSSYVTLDGTVQLRTRDDRWELALIGKNLTNRFYVTGSQDTVNTGTGTGTHTAVPADQLGLIAAPRTVRMQVTARF